MPAVSAHPSTSESESIKPGVYWQADPGTGPITGPRGSSSIQAQISDERDGTVTDPQGPGANRGKLTVTRTPISTEIESGVAVDGTADKEDLRYNLLAPNRSDRSIHSSSRPAPSTLPACQSDTFEANASNEKSDFKPSGFNKKFTACGTCTCIRTPTSEFIRGTSNGVYCLLHKDSQVVNKTSRSKYLDAESCFNSGSSLRYFTTDDCDNNSSDLSPVKDNTNFHPASSKSFIDTKNGQTNGCTPYACIHGLNELNVKKGNTKQLINNRVLAAASFVTQKISNRGNEQKQKVSPRNRSSIITTLSPRAANKRGKLHWNNVGNESERIRVTSLGARKTLLGTASLQQQHPIGAITNSASLICAGNTQPAQMPALESTFNASQALKDCEELTSWANEILKTGLTGNSVSDLRKSIADGTTLPDLIYILSGERVGVTTSGVLTRGQKTENIKQCVESLSKQGVDVASVIPKELTDGNLKATLMLMNSLRRRYDQPVRRETADGAVQPPQTSSRPTSAHARIPPDPSDMPPPLKPRTSSRSSDVSNMIYRRQHEAAMDMLPGSLAKEENAKINGMSHIISTTELDSQSVSQRGVDERRANLPAPSRQAPAPPPRPQRNSLDHGGPLGLNGPPHPGPPSSATQAWVSSNVHKSKHVTNGNDEIDEAVSQTVGERLKSLLTSPGANQPTRLPSNGPPQRHVTARTNPPLPSDDGELLLPPPRKPHEQYYGSWPGIDNKALDIADVTLRHLPPGQSPVGHHDEEDLYPSSYVPSHPTERSKGSRGQVILDRSVRPASTESSSPSRFAMPGQYPTYSPSAGQRVSQPPPPPRYQPPPQYGSTRQTGTPLAGGNINQAYLSSPKPVPKVGGGNTDLRNACSRLYGSSQDVNVRNSQSPYTNGQGDVGTWNKYNNQTQPRASPQGQSNSTPTSHSSSSHSHSPGSSAGQDRPEPPRPPPPSSARMAGLTSPPAQLPINEMSRLSLQSANGLPYTSRPGPLPQGPHPHHPDNRQQQQHPQHQSDKVSANKPPPHSMHSERILNQNGSGAPLSVRQSPRIINGNGVYSQVNRDPSHERVQGIELPKNNNEKKLNNGAPELPPKRLDPSPIIGRRSVSISGVAHPPSYKDTLEMQQLRIKPDQLGKAGAINLNRNQMEYDSAQGLSLQSKQMLPPSKWQGSVNLNNGDLPLNGRYSPSASSRSITPPLPPLSPADTPPVTPPDSPTGPKFRTQVSNPAGFLPDKTPDVVNSAKKGIPPSGRRKSSRRLNGGGVAVKTWDGRHKRMPSSKPTARYSSRPYANGRQMDITRSDEEDSDNFEADSQLGSTTAASGTEVDVDEREIRVIRQQLQGLETMYHEILKLLGVDQDQSGSRRSISSQSSVSRTGRRSRHPHSRAGVVRSKEVKQINKRFARLESHVVTLARSVAHLSSEMRSHVTTHPDIEEIKREIKRLKELSVRGDHKAFANEWERFRGWVPSLTNPKRVNKLTQFFGQEPPLLHIFLKKLGYEKYVTNFEQERIGMIELPYMTEDRLQRIGIPMGPRLRILQEAQMCFRQENFDIYIV